MAGLILLYRHAHAGSRERWEADDRLRPLSGKGRRQAQAMAAKLAGLPIGRLLSSPYLRCVQTVRPLAELLAKPVEQTDALVEGASLAGFFRLMEQAMPDGTVLCTHGDLMEAALQHLQEEGAQFQDEPNRCEKGSVWVVEAQPGSPPRARYLPSENVA